METSGPATGAYGGREVHARREVRSHWQVIVFMGPCGVADCPDCPTSVEQVRSLIANLGTLAEYVDDPL